MSSGCLSETIEFLQRKYKVRFKLDVLGYTGNADEQSECTCLMLNRFPTRIKKKIAIAFIHLPGDCPHSLTIYKERKYIRRYDDCEYWDNRTKKVEFNGKFWLDPAFSCRRHIAWNKFSFSYFITYKGYSNNIKPKKACDYINNNLIDFESDFDDMKEWKNKWNCKTKDQELKTKLFRKRHNVIGKDIGKLRKEVEEVRRKISKLIEERSNIDDEISMIDNRDW